MTVAFRNLQVAQSDMDKSPVFMRDGRRRRVPWGRKAIAFKTGDPTQLCKIAISNQKFFCCETAQMGAERSQAFDR
jgi:hypothetical protein